MTASLTNRELMLTLGHAARAATLLERLGDRHELHGGGREEHAPFDAFDCANHLGDDKRCGLELQVTVPCEGHEDVGGEKKADG